jgi:pimeloyl-ACP methyl ester carboxylesterase
VLELYRSVTEVGAAGERLAASLRPLDRPARVLWGRHDPYIPVRYAERQREAFPRAEVLVLDGSGHWPFADDPGAVAAAVDGFLARRRGPDPAGSLGPPAEEVPADARQREAEHPGHLGR